MTAARQQMCLQLDDRNNDCGCSVCLPLMDYEVAAKEASEAWRECRAAERRYESAARDLDYDRFLRRAVWETNEALALHLQKISDTYNAELVTHPAHAGAPTPPISGPAGAAGAAGAMPPQRAAAVVAEVRIAAAAVGSSPTMDDDAGPSIGAPAQARRNPYAGRAERSVLDAVFGASDSDSDEELAEDAARAAGAHGGPLAAGCSSPQYHAAAPRTRTPSPVYCPTSPSYRPGAVAPPSYSPSSSTSTPSPTWSPPSSPSPSPSPSPTPFPATHAAPVTAGRKRPRANSAPPTLSKRRSLAQRTPSPCRFPSRSPSSGYASRSPEYSPTSPSYTPGRQ